MPLTLPQLDEPREAKEKCGVVGIWGEEHPARLAFLSLYALQHRGQESAGLCTTDGRIIDRAVGMGLVSQAITQRDIERLDAHAAARATAHAGKGVRKWGGAIGHNRYSTMGPSAAANAQPLVGHYRGGPVALAHNGNLVNAVQQRKELEGKGHAFSTTSDTEVMLALMAAASRDKECDALAEALQQVSGAFSIVVLHQDRIEAARDPFGWRPLAIGKLPSGSYFVASETVALDVLGATYVRDVEPGEIVTLSDDGLSSRRFAEASPRRAHCVFEHVYFASPASLIFGQTVQTVRERLGAKLAEEAPVEADLVMPMPDSGRSAATGYARASGLPYREGIIPNRYVGRTFIKPTDAERAAAVRVKLNIVSEVVRDKRVVIVDDSVVRGTTTKIKMDQVRAAGAKEVHLRISCPPIRYPCFFGVDFADPSELIATNRSVEKIREIIGVDSLHFLSIDGMLSVAACADVAGEHFCTACYSGEYRIAIDPALRKHAMTGNC
ncbi:MAG: amidophosphoribosyltransferase [Phycisphaerales bacterium]|nr:amidophosphoribosyltransferase [Phycisphaerales bacterium]